VLVAITQDAFSSSSSPSLSVSSSTGNSIPTWSGTPRITTSKNAKQKQTKPEDEWGNSHWQCSRCNIEYRTKGDHGACPLCTQHAITAQLRDEVKKLSNASDLLKRDLSRLRAQLSVLDGMREAASEVGQEDAMLLKELIYRYRANPDQVRVTQLIRDRKGTVPGLGPAVRHEVSGWLVDYSDVEPTQRVTMFASSIGGVALALQFSEALKITGLKGAMEMLIKAMAKYTTNA
jgi:hypothetical protein